ncbi:MAG: putative ABC transporter ATP-binding protein [Microgenomates bacterium OLB22]|nr:MAG: putative ABC transporter ATP-binding protein [Microgenomates bacterium OLB22]
MLSVKDLSVSIQKKRILEHFTCSFDIGKTYALMGPNGSGKSTFGAALMGHPQYDYNSSAKITFNGEELSGLETDQRAVKGLSMTFQHPLGLPGVNLYQVLRHALPQGHDPVEARKKLNSVAQKLSIPQELLSRPLHEGFSGGERKKIELAQVMMLEPSFLICDEIDTGVDVDALQIIAKSLVEYRTKKRTVILITHYTRLLQLVPVDEVIVLMRGQIVARGGADLAHTIEKDGYSQFITA